MSQSTSPGSSLQRSNSAKRRSHPSTFLSGYWSRKLLEEDEPNREVTHERELTTSSKLSASLDNLNLLGFSTESQSTTEPVSSSGSISVDFGDSQPTRMRSFSGPLHVQVARGGGSGSSSPTTPSSSCSGGVGGGQVVSGSNSGSGTPPICSSPVPISSRKQCFSPALQISVHCPGTSPVAQLSPLAVVHASASPSSLSSTSLTSSTSCSAGPSRKRRSADHSSLVLPSMLFGSGDESSGEEQPPRKRLSLSGARLVPSSSSSSFSSSTSSSSWASGCISSSSDVTEACPRPSAFVRSRLETAMEEQVSSSDDVASV